MIGLGLEEEIKPGLSVEETIDKISSSGGVAIAPHPFTFYGLRNLIFNLKIDALEVFTPWPIIAANKKAQSALSILKIAPIGSTDAHNLGIVGKIFTKVKVKNNSVDEILNAIKNLRTKAESNFRLKDAVYNLLKDAGLTATYWVR